MPNAGLLTIEDAETGEVLELDTSSAGIQRRFAQTNAERLADFAKIRWPPAVLHYRCARNHPEVAYLRQVCKHVILDAVLSKEPLGPVAPIGDDALLELTERFDGAKIRKSIDRLNNLGFFEEVNVEMEPTDQPEQLDMMEIEVVSQEASDLAAGEERGEVGRHEVRSHQVILEPLNGL